MREKLRSARFVSVDRFGFSQFRQCRPVGAPSGNQRHSRRSASDNGKQWPPAAPSGSEWSSPASSAGRARARGARATSIQKQSEAIRGNQKQSEARLLHLQDEREFEAREPSNALDRVGKEAVGLCLRGHLRFRAGERRERTTRTRVSERGLAPRHSRAGLSASPPPPGRSTQKHPEAIRSNQKQSEAIRSNQKQSLTTPRHAPHPSRRAFSSRARRRGAAWRAPPARCQS